MRILNRSAAWKFTTIRLTGYVLLPIGIALIVFAWFRSYPVIPSVDQSLFDQFSPFLWVGQSIVFVSLFLIAESSRDRRVKLLCASTLVFFLYVHYLFFILLPGPDPPYFRGLTALSQVAGLNPALTSYFQWPSFFIIADFISQTAGFSINVTSTVMFVITGVALSSSLFLYYYDESETSGFAEVALYFTGLLWFVDYQFAPQSIALALFLVCAHLVRRNDPGSRLSSLLVFVTLVLMHAFMPVLFLLFYLIIVLRGQGRTQSFTLYLVIYFIHLIYLTASHLGDLIRVVRSITYLSLSPDYVYILQITVHPVLAPVDAIAQVFSRWIILSIWLLLAAGMMIRIVKRDVGVRNFSLLVTGLLYSGIGVVVNLIGYRGLQLIFVPLASGCRSFSTRYRRVLNVFLLLVLALYPIVLIHQVYSFPAVQTASGERASETLIQTIGSLSGQLPTSVLGTHEDACYIIGRIGTTARTNLTVVPLESSSVYSYKPLNVTLSYDYTYIIYGPSLKDRITDVYSPSLARTYRNRLTEDYNRVWDDGSTSILNAKTLVAYFQFFPTC